MALLRMLWSVTMTYFSMSNIPNVNISETVRASGKMHYTSFLYILLFSIERRHCKFYTQWPWPTFQDQVLQIQISQKQTYIKCRIDFFIDFDICNQMEPLRKSYSVTITHILRVKITIYDQAVPADLHQLLPHRCRVALVIFTNECPHCEYCIL